MKKIINAILFLLIASCMFTPNEEATLLQTVLWAVWCAAVLFVCSIASKELSKWDDNKVNNN